MDSASSFSWWSAVAVAGISFAFGVSAVVLERAIKRRRQKPDLQAFEPVAASFLDGQFLARVAFRTDEDLLVFRMTRHASGEQLASLTAHLNNLPALNQWQGRIVVLPFVAELAGSITKET